jgi:hypothetical protein
MIQRPPSESGSVDALQRRASAWAEGFARDSKAPSFALASYLEPLAAQAGALPAFSEGAA